MLTVLMFADTCNRLFNMGCLTLNVLVNVCAAVQEERQRGKERGENEVESTSSFNDDMPVEKILDAELAVEPKTETYSDGSPGNSVRTAVTGLSLAKTRALADRK